MDSMFNILLVTTAYPSSLDPLNGTFVQDLARCLSLKHKVTVLHCARIPKNSGFNSGLNKINDNKITVVHVFVKETILPWTFSIIFGIFKGINFLKKQKIQFDIIHAHFFPSVIPFLFVLRNIPVILTEHWSGFPLRQLTKFNRLIAQFVMKHCKLVCPVSQYLLSSIKSYGINANFKVIPNTINHNSFYYKKKEIGNKINVLIIGRQVPEKNTPTVLEAINMVSKIRSDFHLDIIGGGSYLDEYINLSKKLHIEDVVKFHGFVERKKVLPFIQSADFVIIPAGTETQSVVMNEVMSCGKPILASDTGAPKEFIDDSVGILVASNNVQELKNGIIFMLDNIKKFDPLEGVKRAKSYFSYQSVLHQYDIVYNMILRNHS